MFFRIFFPHGDALVGKRFDKIRQQFFFGMITDVHFVDEKDGRDLVEFQTLHNGFGMTLDSVLSVDQHYRQIQNL